MQKIKGLFKSMQSKHGTYSVGMIAVVVGIVVVANLIFGRLPEKIQNIDISDNKIYEITDTSKELLANLEQKVTLTVVAEDDSIDDRIKTFINKYAELSKNISVEWVDPVLHPSALSDYDTSENSVVVSCEETGKSDSILFSDIIVYDEYAYYYSGTTTESEFDGEGQLTSAINTVTNDVTKKIYQTAGHGEGTFSSSIQEAMEKSNFTLADLNLLMEAEIPEDCDLLIMNAPTTDLTEDEKNTVTAYLQGGGKLMFILGDTDKATPNLDVLLEEYGMQKAEGYIADVERCYQGNYYYIFPEITASGDMAKGLSTNMVLLVNSLGMNEVDAARDTISLDRFMTTSSNGYAITEENQTQGTFILGAVATETLEDEELESRFTVIAASTMIDSGITDSFSTVENITLFMNAVTSNFDDVENVSIEPKSLEVQYNTVQHAGAFSMLVIFGIPAVILIAGFGVWIKRRKA